MKIPKEVKDIVEKFENKGFEAYPVGGCVRDIVAGETPEDWDITTNAKPDEIIEIFPDSVYENDFGTVAIKTESEDETLKIIEVTTFRTERGYSDNRRPDKVEFTDKVEEDLARRDFTINALALDIKTKEFIDPYEGERDLSNKIVKTVGSPDERFQEDALRLIRAVRFAIKLGFKLEEQTKKSILKNSELIKTVAVERIRVEFEKIIMTSNAEKGIRLLQKTGLLKNIVPELEEGIGVQQNEHHIYTVWEHNVRALKYSAEKDYSLEVRLASLFHDIGKPKTKEGKGKKATFHNHEIVGANIVKKILKRLKFPKDTIKKVTHLVRCHMFYYNVGEVSEAGVRRFLKKVGPENVDNLIKVREADRIGSGVPKAVPYKLRHLLFMIEKVKRDPISTSKLAIDGKEVMDKINEKPGPKIGYIMKILLEEVIEDPSKNKKPYLLSKIEELNKLDVEKLEKISKEAEKTRQEFERGIENKIKKKYYVK
ncbi:MAG: HD domain-containing protein [Candidatus Paceibacterota bacterium]